MSDESNVLRTNDCRGVEGSTAGEEDRCRGVVWPRMGEEGGCDSPSMNPVALSADAIDGCVASKLSGISGLCIYRCRFARGRLARRLLPPPDDVPTEEF